MMRSRLVGLSLVSAAFFAASVACSDKKATPPVARDLLADSADQIMYGVKLNMTAGGINRALVVGDTAYFFKDNTDILLLHVKTTFYDKTGQVSSTLTSKTGRYDTRTEQMAARGDAQVVSIDGKELRSEELKFDKYRNEVLSDSAFVLTEPDRRLEGVGFRSDPALQNVRVLRVESGTAGNVTVPTQ